MCGKQALNGVTGQKLPGHHFLLHLVQVSRALGVSHEALHQCSSQTPVQLGFTLGATFGVQLP